MKITTSIALFPVAAALVGLLILPGWATAALQQQEGKCANEVSEADTGKGGIQVGPFLGCKTAKPCDDDDCEEWTNEIGTGCRCENTLTIACCTMYVSGNTPVAHGLCGPPHCGASGSCSIKERHYWHGGWYWTVSKAVCQ